MSIAIAFSADGSTIYAVGGGSDMVVADVATSKQTHTVKIPGQHSFNSIMWDPDHAMLWLIGSSGILVPIDPATLMPGTVIQLHF